MPKIHRNHHNVVFLLHFLKTVCPILRHARVFCTETLPNFLHHEGAGLHHLVAMCSMCVHATKNKTCINSINMCNAMQRHATPLCIVSTQNTSWDLLRFAFSTGSSSFVLKNTEFQSAACFRHLCAREWLKKMFADKSELCGEHEIWNETVRRHTSFLLRFCKEVLGSLLKV